MLEKDSKQVPLLRRQDDSHNSKLDGKNQNRKDKATFNLTVIVKVYNNKVVNNTFLSYINKIRPK